jgi:O-antigen ligase/tetratricopeptide (TPR) repeat protein
LKNKTVGVVRPMHTVFICEKGLELAVWLLIILVPLVFCRGCEDMFFPVKEFIFELLVLAAFLLWIYCRIEGIFFNFKNSILKLTTLDVLILLLACWAAFSLFWSHSFWVTLKELPLFLAGPALYFIIAHPVSDKNPIRSEKIIFALIVIGSLWGLYGILQYFGFDLFFETPQTGRTYRVMGVMGNVNYFAEYLVGIIPAGIGWLLATDKTRKRWMIFTGISIMTICLILTFTRSAYLGFAVALVFIVLFFPLLQRRNVIKLNQKILLIALIISLLAIIIFIFPNPANKPGTFIHTIKNRLSLETLQEELYSGRRRTIWSFTAMMIQDQPLVGSGLGTFPYLSLDYQAQFFQLDNNRDIFSHGYAKHVHNEYLQLGAELGLVGLALFIAIIIAFFSYGIKGLRRMKDRQKSAIVIGLMAAMVAILFDSFFGFPFHLPATLAIFWLYLGMTVNIIRQEKIDKENQQDNSKEEDNKKKILKKSSREEYSFSNKKRVLLSLLFLGVFILFTFYLGRPLISNYYLGEGNRAVRHQNFQQALELYQKALQAEPYNGRVSYSIGKLMAMQNNYGKALDYFLQAEKTYNTHDLPMDMAVAYYYQELFEKAAEKFKQAITYQEDTKLMVPVYTDLGSTYLKMSEFVLAEEFYLKALKINPKFGSASYLLALLYLQQGEQGKAIPYLKKVIRLMPDTQEAKNARTILLQLSEEERKNQSLNQ